ncbi:MAG: hypothetical protein EOP67_02275 [Sphingomonas sp.]|nr:MAG: hypothetical protein EOP67_02275 [Sphingomonas sp.]
MLLTVPSITVAEPAPSRVFDDPVSNASLAAAVGTGAATTRLSVLVGELGSASGQWPAEDQRVQMANWFADNSVQAIANFAVTRG